MNFFKENLRQLSDRMSNSCSCLSFHAVFSRENPSSERHALNKRACLSKTLFKETENR
jgi:hypothetical protein